MKILYVVPRFPTASETFVAEEVLGVRARGHTVTVVALAKPTDAQIEIMGPRLKELAQNTVYLPRIPHVPIAAVAAARPAVLALNHRLSHEAIVKTRASLRFLRAAAVASHARRVGAELIYAHWPRPSEVALLAGEIAALPVGLSIHAHEVAHDNGHFLAAFERVRFAAFCNAAAMGYLLDNLPQTARDKAHLIYHGVNLDQFPPTPLPPLYGTLKLVTAGRLTPTKGFHRLLQAIGMARDQNISVELTVIGDGSERAQLEELAGRLNLGQQVSFAGWIPHEEMRQQLCQAHVFALLADDTFHDGLPNVVLEAMALGRPAIISPLPAAPEAVTTNVNGYVIAKVDALQEFVDCCASLIAAPGRLSNWSQAAAESTRADHDRATQLDRLCALFTRSA